MFALLCFLLAVLALPFKSRSRLEAENAALRHQLIVLRRKVPGRVRLTNNDRWFFIQLYRWFSSILQAFTIIRPETLVRYAGVIGERCALASSGPTIWRHWHHFHPGWTARPIRPDMIFGKDTPKGR